MLGKMFGSAGHKTFGAYAKEVLATVLLMRLWLWFIQKVFVVLGVADAGLTNTPLLGVTGNYFLRSHDLTLETMLVSSFVVLGIFLSCVSAPILEEILFRWFVCRSMASDANGELVGQGRGLGTVLVGSFIFFGLAHGHGVFSIMLQGVMGLFLAILFLRNGPNLRVAVVSCMVAHSLYNISVTLDHLVF